MISTKQFREARDMASFDTALDNLEGALRNSGLDRFVQGKVVDSALRDMGLDPNNLKNARLDVVKFARALNVELARQKSMQKLRLRR
ncbi:MAG: hypothetical protein ABSE71_03370 [Candidatus Micrarchaeaceae archaeon]|jgi:hypothetical protein